MTDDDHLGTAARLKTHLDNQADGNSTPSSSAPFVDDLDHRDVVQFLSQHWDPDLLDDDDRLEARDLPRRFEATQLGGDLAARHRAATAQEAIADGDSEKLAHLVGERDPSGSFSASQLLLKIQDRMSTQGYLGLFCGSTDGGKTATALTTAEIGLRSDPDLTLATNVDPLNWGDPDLDDRTHYVDSTSDLLDHADDFDDSIVLLDEMSTEANAQTSNYDVVEHFYRCITWKAKFGFRILAIAHRVDGKDVAPSIREHADDYIVQERERHRDAPDDYLAHFYGERDDSDGSVSDHRFTLGDVPLPAATYDPDAHATFALAE
jgi:hypothetical protein